MAEPLEVPQDANKPEAGTSRRLGFGRGLFRIPDDFDTMFEKEIEEMFYGNPDKLKYPPGSKKKKKE